MEADFRALFSQAYGCSPDQFEDQMFSKTLFRHAILFAWLIRDKTKFFREDREMLRDIASAHNTPEVISELNRFYGRNRRDNSFLRTSFFIRVSGKRVLQIYRALVQQQPRSESWPSLQPQH
jgi:hypothetical protein